MPVRDIKKANLSKNQVTPEQLASGGPIIINISGDNGNGELVSGMGEGFNKVVNKLQDLNKTSEINQKADIDAGHKQLKALEDKFKAAGGKAEDNAEYNKLSFKLQMKELKLRKSQAETPAAKKEIADEQRKLRENQGGKLSKIANGIGSMWGSMKDGAKKAGKGLMAFLGTVALGGFLILLGNFLKSPHFDKMAKWIKEKLLPGLKVFWTDFVKPFGIWLWKTLVPFFKNVGDLITDPSWKNIKKLLTENTGTVASIATLLAVKTFGIKGMLTGLGEVGGLMKAGWGKAGITKALTSPAMKALIGPMALIAGLALAIKDGVMGFFKSKEWGVSKFSGALGGFLGGVDKGAKGALKNAGKWALIGAGIGSFTVPVIGTLIGGAVGALIGAVLGWFGGEKIAKALDKFGIWCKELWESMVQVVKDVWNKIKKWFTDLWVWASTGIAKGWTNVTGFIRGVWDSVKKWFTDLWVWASGGIAKGWTNLTGFITGIWNSVKKWFTDLWVWSSKGIAKGWTNLAGFIGGVWDSVVKWFEGLWSWGESTGTKIAGSFKGIVSWVGDIFNKVWAWFKGLFCMGNEKEGMSESAKKKAAGGFSLCGIVGSAISGIWKWFKGLLDIDVMAIAKNIPGASTLLGWMRDKSLGEEDKAQIKKHGQTLKGATESGLYDQDIIGNSEINKKALQEGVKSGLVQKEMLDAILADKDLSKEDAAFMKTLVEQATKKRSLYVADLGVHDRLDKIFPVNAPTGGGIIAAQSMLQSRKSLQSQGQSTVAPVSVINQNNQSSVTVADSRSLISSKRQAAYSMAGMYACCH